MQRVLYTEELVQNILNIAFADEKKGASTLASLASTSQLWHTRAVSVLWHTLPNIKPLLRCMPRDIWKTTPRVFDETQTQHCELKRLPGVDDWSRCNYYASFVRWLG
ncbi:hypothetical protein BDN72DRAFT_583880 [Pluteus cervinus]|uniref:Uncharacterized protein n=1 Tax=Pluteus cervinus TaxID=181527 RepID=A0ACD3AX73_9AGAR|nr:hypothetical protein BDN72DRAFT_583880 [Pluteus cervinus]